MKRLNEEFLTRIMEKMINRKNIFSVVLSVESGKEEFSWTGAAGDMQPANRYFIASVTKLYITAIVLRLIEEDKLSLEERIASHLPAEILVGLHIYRGRDYSSELTILHLISNTSGLPDYFFHKQDNGKTAASSLLSGRDESWQLEKTLQRVKALHPRFIPGQKGKASYSDTNYQLLGKIIENITGKTLAGVLQEYICEPLDLQQTYVYTDVSDNSPRPFYYKSQKLWLPNYIASVSAEGGIVTTAAEMMIFLKAFFKGYFFPVERIAELKKWNWILPPPGLFLYGVGLEKIWTPRFISPLKPVGEILGFWGQTGSFAWYNTATDLYFCGTTNQIDGSGHAAAARAILKIIKQEL